MSADDTYDICCNYAYYWPQDLVKDAVGQRWSFTMKLANLLGEPIGTLDGTTVSGVRLVLRDRPETTGGRGAVTVANADGEDTFTAPNQPYWLYEQLIQPNQWSDEHRLAFNVPNTVTSFRINLIMAAHLPAELSVTATPPDSVPAWVSADTNVGGPTAAMAGRFWKNVVRVQFTPTASLFDKQLAVAMVGGVVVGGHRSPDGPGFYVLRVADSGSGRELLHAVQKLLPLPQVSRAHMVVLLGGAHLEPYDSGDRHHWSFSPASVDVTEQRWPKEMIFAPIARGCSTGTISGCKRAEREAFRHRTHRS